MTQETFSTHTVYQQLLTCCPPLRLDSPWDFLNPGPDCYAPVCDPEATLAFLRQQFSDDVLQETGVAFRTPEGDFRLRPALCDPAGAVIALRGGPDQEPFDLLTSCGCLVSPQLPILAAARDARTAAGVNEGGMLLASCSIREVALLRALGWPATLATEPSTGGLEQLRALAATYSYASTCEGANPDHFSERPSPASEDGGEGEAPAEPPVPGSPEASPSQLSVAGLPDNELILVGWDLLGVSQQVPAIFHQIAAQFGAAARHLVLDFSAIHVWRLKPTEMETLVYRLGYRDVGLIQEFIQPSVQERYDLQPLIKSVQERYDLQPLIKKESKLGKRISAADEYIEAQSALITRLKEERSKTAFSQRVHSAICTFEKLTRRNLIAPLQQWALEDPDPAIRNADWELANVCSLLHQLSPMLHEQQQRELETYLTNSREEVPRHQLFAQYMQLSIRLSRLLTNLCQLRNAK